MLFISKQKSVNYNHINNLHLSRDPGKLSIFIPESRDKENIPKRETLVWRGVA